MRLVRSSGRNGMSSFTNWSSVATIFCIIGSASRDVVSISSSWRVIVADLVSCDFDLLGELSL